MYKLLLILKYLRKRRIAWVSLIAVMLCTAMVLVVISVMGGWLRMFKSSFQGLSGDVVVRGDSRVGFPHYEEMIRRLEALPEVTAAVPMIETFALINIDNQIRDGVRTVGVPLDRIGEVNSFWDSLYLKNPDGNEQALADWRAIIEGEVQSVFERVEQARREGVYSAEEAEREKQAIRAIADGEIAQVERAIEREAQKEAPDWSLPFDPEIYRLKLSLGTTRPAEAPDAASYPGMIVGTGVLGQRKDARGEVDRWYNLSPTNPPWAKLMTLRIDPDRGNIDIETDKGERTYWIVDTSRTGVFQTDEQTIYVPFELLQLDLGMEEREGLSDFDLDTFETSGEAETIPARTGEIHVNLADGVELLAGRALVERVVDAVNAELGTDPRFPISVQTWEERYGDFLQAVEKEKLLVTVLFSFISIVAIFLIFCIFYMIVQEKVKDIGIVKSVGATDGGIAVIFLGYGGAIGIVGGGLGILAGWMVVHWINEIHELMGRLLGVQIWSAQTYMFDRIPNTIDLTEAAWIFGVAVLSSVLGAVVPAYRAARLRPVDSLRFE